MEEGGHLRRRGVRHLQDRRDDRTEARRRLQARRAQAGPRLDWTWSEGRCRAVRVMESWRSLRSPCGDPLSLSSSDHLFRTRTGEIRDTTTGDPWSSPAVVSGGGHRMTAGRAASERPVRSISCSPFLCPLSPPHRCFPRQHCTSVQTDPRCGRLARRSCGTRTWVRTISESSSPCATNPPPPLQRTRRTHRSAQSCVDGTTLVEWDLRRSR
mgnify:CR=1 FL=1